MRATRMKHCGLVGPWRLTTLLLSVLVVMGTTVAAGGVGAPGLENLIYEAAYEAPFAAVDERPHVAGKIAYPSSSVLFRIWSDGRPSFLSGHFRAGLRDCWSKEVHFCMQSGYMTLAVPSQSTKGAWSHKVGDRTFVLVSKQKTTFRGSEIDTITIRQIPEIPAHTTFFVYSYDVGVIAFANLYAENVSPTAPDMPNALWQAMVLRSQSGVGGRDYCKHWKCGSANR